jgi:hypothetical protein
MTLIRIVEAGGTLEPWQLRRAVEPILGDLLEELVATKRRATSSTAWRSPRVPTVDAGKDKGVSSFI